jgi:chitodextrinase
MLQGLGYCGNREIIRNFLAQTAYETGYFTTLGQPIDDGAGIIHMIPANWDANAADMEALFPGEGIKADYDSRNVAGKKMFFKEAKYAFKSAAAWFKRTNRVIPGCGKDLFPLSLNEQTACILGRVNDRSEALGLVSKHIPLSGVVPSNPPTSTPVLPTPRPTMKPTLRPTPMPTTSGGGSSSNSCAQELWSTGKVYTGGNEAQYDGALYRAKWWTQNNKPSSGGPWEFVKSCVEAKAQVCGGVPEYINGNAYSGGSLVSFNGKVYKAKWWVTGVPDQSDIWAYVKDCETVQANVAQSLVRFGEPEPKQNMKYRTFLEVAFSGLSDATSRPLTLQEVEEQVPTIKDKATPEFTVSLLKQYGQFIDVNDIKGFEMKATNIDGRPSIVIILELEYDNPQDAADAVAVLKQYESLIALTFKMTAQNVAGIGVESAKVMGNSGVVEAIDPTLGDADTNNTSGTSAAAVPSSMVFGALCALTLLVR